MQYAEGGELLHYILKQQYHSTDTTVDLSICMEPKYEKLLN